MDTDTLCLSLSPPAGLLLLLLVALFGVFVPCHLPSSWSGHGVTGGHQLLFFLLVLLLSFQCGKACAEPSKESCKPGAGSREAGASGPTFGPMTSQAAGPVLPSAGLRSASPAASASGKTAPGAAQHAGPSPRSAAAGPRRRRAVRGGAATGGMW